MNYFWERFTLLLVVIWVGSLLSLGAIAAPVLFSTLDDKQLAGMLAGKMFAVGAWVGMAAGTFLLLHRLTRDWRSALKSLSFWVVLLMFFLTVAGHFGIQPILQNLKNQALPLAVMQSVFADRFSEWHGISRILWIIQTLLGLVLVWRLRLAR